MQWEGEQFTKATGLVSLNPVYVFSLPIIKILFELKLLCCTALRFSATVTNFFIIPFYFLYQCVNFWIWEYFPAPESCYGWLLSPFWVQNSGIQHFPLSCQNSGIQHFPLSCQTSVLNRNETHTCELGKTTNKYDKLCLSPNAYVVIHWVEELLAM